MLVKCVHYQKVKENLYRWTVRSKYICTYELWKTNHRSGAQRTLKKAAKIFFSPDNTNPGSTTGNPEDNEKPSIPFQLSCHSFFLETSVSWEGPKFLFLQKICFWGQYFFFFLWKEKLQVTKKKIRIFSKGWKMPMIQKPLYICKSKPKSYMGMYKKSF